MTLAVQPVGQAHGHLIGQAGGHEAHRLGIQHRGSVRQHGDQLLGAQAGDARNLRLDQQLREIQTLAQLGDRRVHIADAHLTDLQQGIDRLLVAGLLEEVAERARDFTADVRHALEQRPRQVADQLQIAEPDRQGLGGAFTDMLDAQREQQALQRGGAAGVDGGDQVVGPLGRDLLRVPGERGRHRQRLRAPSLIAAIQLEQTAQIVAAAFRRQMQADLTGQRLG
ncbi:hypothetical protein D3C71_1269650 [compost metagenome]